MTWKSWIIATLVLTVLEILPPSTHFFFLCLAFGALGASISSFFAPQNIWLAWGVFIFVSLGCVPLLMPLAKFLFATKPSDSEGLLGEKALVVEKIQPGQPGTVHIRGEVWRAINNETTIEVDESVIIERIDGTHVVVRKA